ncbi:hypothetical protein AXF13_07775 [Desulfovibrio fairfieldensis]|uniref:Uncharacterized protein n=1 Tax=Desulfovibrio fairfieldensis TaxID=44742 RepID=A0A0X8JJQ1_9BACT|nr:hypothetical protein AXF13_07775 [Desulfovibrio fairfieldensis]
MKIIAAANSAPTHEGHVLLHELLSFRSASWFKNRDLSAIFQDFEFMWKCIPSQTTAAADFFVFPETQFGEATFTGRVDRLQSGIRAHMLSQGDRTLDMATVSTFKGIMLIRHTLCFKPGFQFRPGDLPDFHNSSS